MEKQTNLSITVGGKSFLYTFDTKEEVEEIISNIRYNVIEKSTWVEIKGDIFRILEIQAVTK